MGPRANCWRKRSLRPCATTKAPGRKPRGTIRMARVGDAAARATGLTCALPVVACGEEAAPASAAGVGTPSATAFVTISSQTRTKWPCNSGGSLFAPSPSSTSQPGRTARGVLKRRQPLPGPSGLFRTPDAAHPGCRLRVRLRLPFLLPRVRRASTGALRYLDLERARRPYGRYPRRALFRRPMGAAPS